MAWSPLLKFGIKKDDYLQFVPLSLRPVVHAIVAKMQVAN